MSVLIGVARNKNTVEHLRDTGIASVVLPPHAMQDRQSTKDLSYDPNYCGKEHRPREKQGHCYMLLKRKQKMVNVLRSQFRLLRYY